MARATYRYYTYVCTKCLTSIRLFRNDNERDSPIEMADCKCQEEREGASGTWERVASLGGNRRPLSNVMMNMTIAEAQNEREASRLEAEAVEYDYRDEERGRREHEAQDIRRLHRKL